MDRVERITALLQQKTTIDAELKNRHKLQRPSCAKIPSAKECSGKGPMRKICIPLMGVEQCLT
jgi:hypothetical protein